MEQRARLVLDEAHRLLEEVSAETIWEAIARGAFADVRRTREGGKGYAGVVLRDEGYLNPFLEALESNAPGESGAQAQELARRRA